MGQLFYPLWGGLLDAVRTGEPAAMQVLGRPAFEHLTATPGLSTEFDRLMQAQTVDAARAVAARARTELATAGLAHRAGAIGGDFFAEVPPGGDVYILSFILHDWDDDSAVALLRVIRRAMHPDAGLLVVEQLLSEDAAGPAITALYDLHMLVVNGGAERTRSQYRALLADARLRHTATVATSGPRYVIEARPQ